jgi:hypothetical protein
MLQPAQSAKSGRALQSGDFPNFYANDAAVYGARQEIIYWPVIGGGQTSQGCLRVDTS